MQNPPCLRRLTISEGGARGKAQHAIAHERLAIMDPESGAQPLFAAAQRGPDGSVTVEEASVIVAANGEIYNYKELYAELAADGFAYAPKTGSDPCGSNLQLDFNVRACDRFDAIFSAVLRELDASNRFVHKSA